MSLPTPETLVLEVLGAAVRAALHTIGVDACAGELQRLLLEHQKLAPEVARAAEAPADEIDTKKFGPRRKD